MLAAFSITPMGVGESVGDTVTKVVRRVRDSGLPNETNAMFTNVEGDWDEVMDLVKSCVETAAEDSSRVSLVLKVDYRPGAHHTMTAKVKRVEDSP